MQRTTEGFTEEGHYHTAFVVGVAPYLARIKAIAEDSNKIALA